MKKTKLLLIACASIFFAACSNGTDGGGGSEDENFIYTIPANETSITFPSSCSGKNAYLICSNTSSSNVSNTSIGVKFNQNEVNEQRAVSSKMTIEEKAIYMGNGYYRDEVRFDVPKLDLSKKNSTRVANSSSNYRDLTSNEFFVEISGDNSFTKNAFTKKAEGTHCRIWYLNNNTSVNNSYLSPSVFQRLANTFDLAFVKETQIFGSNYFSYDGMIAANANTKLEILVYDLFGDATDNQTSGTFGFQNPDDFFLNEKAGDTSNECEVIHIDSYFLNLDIKNNTRMVESTLFHEFQHLLNYCNKYGQYDTWFTEMLAMCSEDILQSQIGLSDDDTAKSRFYTYFNYPYKGFGNWPDPKKDPNYAENVLYAYANAYAFGAYLMRNYGGIELIHEIATNQYKGTEYAISAALKAIGKSEENFNTVFNKFGTVYIFPEANKNSLNINISNTFKGTVYNLSAINLNEYVFRLYNSESALRSDMNNLYVENNSTGSNQDKSLYGIFGPCIFKSNYTLTEPIQSKGFVVYYLGKVQDGKTYNVTHKQNLTMTVVVKD